MPEPTKSKRIKMINTYANAHERLVQDKTYTVDEPEASQLVRSGDAIPAEPSDADASTQAAPPSVTAPVSTPVQPRAVGGKGAGKSKRK